MRAVAGSPWQMITSKRRDCSYTSTISWMFIVSTYESTLRCLVKLLAMELELTCRREGASDDAIVHR